MKRKILIISAIMVIMLFAGQAFGIDITFQWDANTESDLVGYRLYYKISTTGGPAYNGSGATEGASPIDVGKVTEVTIHNIISDEDLAAGLRVWAVVTAYNILQLESEFSNEVDAGVPTEPGNLSIKIPSP